MQVKGEPAVGRPIGFGAALIRVLRLSFRVRGRASRREFWYFFLVYAALFVAIGLTEDAADEEWVQTAGTVIYLAGLVPFVSVGVRRLHDVGRSGWWCLIMISCFGWLFLLAWWSGRGQGENRFGSPGGCREPGTGSPRP